MGMAKNDGRRIAALLERLARLAANDSWEGGLNPTQVAILSYLHRANRFSRAPSHVADYLGATRGTVSQSLKSLRDKGLVRESRSASDRRSISFDLTEAGEAIAAERSRLDRALERMPDAERAALSAGLADLLRAMLAAGGGRPFGICRDCRHHRHGADGRYCALLEVPLAEEEAGLICHEQAPAAA